MEYKDYYQILGVERGASEAEIKKAYRRLARRFHPDVSKEADAQQRMRDVNEANAVLSDNERRAVYDAMGSAPRPGEPFRPPPDWHAGFEFSGRGFDEGDGQEYSDFFAELFSRMGGRRPPPGSRAAWRARGEDHHAKIVLELADAYRGGERQITLRVPRLDGAGRMTHDTRTLDVKIPKGVHEGQRIRLAGLGTAGHGGAPAGDLLLEVQFEPHSRFAVDGRNVSAELPVAPWEAALGAVVEVKLPDHSTIKLRIPAGAQSGRQLTVRGKGIPGQPPGDLDLTVRVVLPPADTPQAKALYETMARELAFDPRAPD